MMVDHGTGELLSDGTIHCLTLVNGIGMINRRGMMIDGQILVFNGGSL